MSSEERAIVVADGKVLRIVRLRSPAKPGGMDELCNALATVVARIATTPTDQQKAA